MVTCSFGTMMAYEAGPPERRWQEKQWQISEGKSESSGGERETETWEC